MSLPGRIKKLDEVVVNRIAAGEIIQRPANALKELIENSLDAKATNIQIIAKEGGLKLLQIQDNGTGIRKEDMEIVCERFTTSKLQQFDDLKTISTFGFRGEALASISHVALLTITTKTADEKCAYKATYIDSKLKAPPKSCAGNQGTTILIENLFYNVATRRKALGNASEEFGKITDVVTKYAVHNPMVGFVLKKDGQVTPQVRTPHNSTKMNNIRILYGNPIARELLEVELEDETYKFKMHALLTNPNYSSKRMIFLLFINNRLVESSTIHKMLEELYSIYLPKKSHPWCYISLDINPQNVDVNVHPTKHEVRFLHEDSIIERMKCALDEKLVNNSASRTFYLNARLPTADITRDALKEVLPEYEKDCANTLKKTHAREMIRTDSCDQKLDKFNFTIHAAMKTKDQTVNDSLLETSELRVNETLKPGEGTSRNHEINVNLNEQEVTEHSSKETEVRQVHVTSEIQSNQIETSLTPWSDIINQTTTLTSSQNNSNASVQSNAPQSVGQDDSMQAILESIKNDFPETVQEEEGEECVDVIADKARKRVYQYFGKKSDVSNDNVVESNENVITEVSKVNNKATEEPDKPQQDKVINTRIPEDNSPDKGDDGKQEHEFKSYSVNNFRREVKLTSILKLRKEVETDCHEGLREILSALTFVGCIDETSALVQSGVNLYICNTKKLAEELFYEIMLYDFANYGVIKFSDAISLYDLALLGLNTKEAGWTEEDGPKEELATSVKELLLEKADMLKEYFSIVIDKRGNLKSLPILLDKYFPFEGGLPMYILRLATEVEWSMEQPCFRNICRETAMFYSKMNPVHDVHDWKYIAEHILYPAIKESLLPPKHFAHDSTILQIASLPNLYKVFERC